MKTITFIGDILCERPLLRATRRGRGYDFTPVFSDCRAFFAESDWVVGNLETVFAGRKAGYTKDLFSFNAPDEFARAMAQAGVRAVTVAGNHILDRGKSGLIRTLDVLDSLGVSHTGAARSPAERERILSRNLDGARVALLSYAYGTNTCESPCLLDESERYMVNLLMPQKAPPARGSLRARIRRALPDEAAFRIKRALGREYVNRYTDALDLARLDEAYLETVRRDVAAARREHDLVVACLHVGGQFNAEPGAQAAYFTRFLAQCGADFIVNTHAHVVQRAQRVDGAFAAHCLGNFSLSPSSLYVPHELKPEYSVALRLRVGRGQAAKISFSILKIVEDAGGMLRVFPLDELEKRLSAGERESLRRDAAFIYRRFTGRSEGDFRVEHEYDFEV